MYAAAATNDQDINDIFGKGGSHTAPNTVQTGGGPGQRIGQGSAQSGGQRTPESGGQSASKPSSGTQSSGSASSGSAGTNFEQGMQASHPSCTCDACIRSNPCNSNLKAPYSRAFAWVIGWQSVLVCFPAACQHLLD